MLLVHACCAVDKRLTSGYSICGSYLDDKFHVSRIHWTQVLPTKCRIPCMIMFIGKTMRIDEIFGHTLYVYIYWMSSNDLIINTNHIGILLGVWFYDWPIWFYTRKIKVLGSTFWRLLPWTLAYQKRRRVKRVWYNAAHVKGKVSHADAPYSSYSWRFGIKWRWNLLWRWGQIVSLEGWWFGFSRLMGDL